MTTQELRTYVAEHPECMSDVLNDALDQLAAMQELHADFLKVHAFGRCQRRADAAEQELAAARAELAQIDDRLARRPALADCTSRASKVERACSVASRADDAERQVADWKGRAERQYARLAAVQEKLKEADSLRWTGLMRSRHPIWATIDEALALCAGQE